MLSCKVDDCRSESVNYRPAPVSVLTMQCPAPPFLIHLRVAIIWIFGLLHNMERRATISFGVSDSLQPLTATFFAGMAAWRFGCEGDCSWEWNMVTLGIVAAVLAALLLLFIICDGDVSGGCACFSSCLLLLLIILMGVGFGLGLHSSGRPYRSPRHVTIYNQQCWSRCSQEGTTFFWCW